MKKLSQFSPTSPLQTADSGLKPHSSKCAKSNKQIKTLVFLFPKFLQLHAMSYCLFIHPHVHVILSTSFICRETKCNRKRRERLIDLSDTIFYIQFSMHH